MTRAADRSRAELVRKRRVQQTDRRLSESSVLARRPLAPITSRAGRGSVAAPNLGSARVKPRDAAAISMPGIELRMPAVRFTSQGVKWRLLSFALSALLTMGLYEAWTAPELRAAPQVTGNQRISGDEIVEALGVQGMPVFALNPSALETRLRLNYPELRSARVTVDLPNRVLVNVVERTPAILWQQGAGYTWIDDGGVAFRPRGAADNLITVQALAEPMPVAAAHMDPLSPIPFLPADLVAAVRQLAPSAPQGSPLVFDPHYGLGWTDERGWNVFFGISASDIELKLRVYNSLVDKLSLEGIVPAFISIAYPSAPYYRMSQ